MSSLDSNSLPAPLTPPECDLRGNKWLPLFGAKLYSSDFDAKASDAEFRAAQKLWWEAWNQVPAGSLPDDDAVLCKLAGLGRDIETWQKLRAGYALYGFSKCSDGRLYHKFLAAEALIAWDMRKESLDEREGTKKRQQRHREKRKAMFAELESRGIFPAWNATTDDLKRLLSQASGGTATATDNTCHGDSAVIHNAPDTAMTGHDNTGQDKKEKGSVASQPPPDGGVSLAPDARTALFNEGLQTLGELTGRPEGPLRSYLGKGLKELKDDAAVLLGIIRDAKAARPADPLAWITAAAKDRAVPKQSLDDKILEACGLAGEFRTGPAPMTSIDRQILKAAGLDSPKPATPMTFFPGAPDDE